jgi:putative membrane protein
MGTLDAARERARAHPRRTTAVLSVLGYALVGGVFAGFRLPALDESTVLLFGDLIAVVNTCALAAIVAGVAFVERGQVRRHRAAMLTAFALIMLFLVLYLWKVGGGFTKEFVVPAGAPLADHAGTVEAAYLVMLAVHVVLSVVAVPVVLHAVVLGLTHTPAELPRTEHPRVGRVAVAAWGLSLFLGVVTYLLLNHVYAWERAASLLFLLSPSLRPRQ